MLELKPGVALNLVTGRMAIGARLVECAYDQMGYTCVITSGNDGVHQDNSKHYVGDALDFRVSIVPQEQHAQLCALIKKKVGSQFDVVYEGDHVHVEWDPK